ncbi:hypothetical protein ACL9RJ_13960 [Pseudomonas sp. Mn2068]|uniref:hypothetical protein n=1 Tax=Pseudomonas sp. Mn2068 TaxID=3395265 RepID=UPI003BE5E06D
MEFDNLSWPAKISETIALHGQPFQPKEAPDSRFSILAKQLEHTWMYARENLYDKRSDVTLELLFLDNKLINAIAQTANKGEDLSDFIMIFRGTLLAIVEISNRLFSRSDFMPDLGNVLVENNNRTHIAQWYADTEVRFAQQVIPLNSVRQQAAQVFSAAVASFVFFHELTHLRNGHTELGRCQYNLPAIAEDHREESVSLPMEIKRTLEIDADTGAIIHLYTYLKHLSSSPPTDKDFNPQIIASFYGDEKRLRQTCLQIIDVYFKLSHQEGWNPEKDKDKTHPGAAFRRWMTYHTFNQFLGRNIQHVKHDTQAFVDQFVTLALEMESIFSDMLNQAPDFKQLTSMIEHQESFNVRLDEFRRCWTSLTPKLEPFVRGGELNLVV